MKIILVVLSIVVVSGCTSVNVRPVSSELDIENVCIEENPKVIVGDFISVLRSGFNRHGVSTVVVNRPAPDECEYVLTYTALQNWDLGTYMHHADLWLRRGGTMVGSAEYRLAGKGGLSLMKWQSTKTKMDPVIDELLVNIKR